MKVLFISNIPSPYRVNFFNELSKQVDVTVIFEAHRAKNISFDWNEDSILFEAIFLKDGDINEKKVNPSIIKHINKDKYDLVVATNYSYYTELFAYLYMSFRRIPFILEIDGGVIQQENHLKHLFKKFLLKKPIAYLSPSKSSDEFLLNYGCNDSNIYRYPFTSYYKKDILETPISSEDKTEIKRKLGFSQEPIILYVGQFVERKGVDLLYEASAMFKKCTVVMIGGDKECNYLRDKGIKEKDNIKFIGFKNSDELKNYYMAADIFVLPTRFDIWGLVINEAMAFGLPIVTTYQCVAGIELVKNNINGYLYNYDNLYDLADKINLLLADQKRRQHFSLNALRIIQAYTIEEMVAAHKRVFDDVKRLK